jgi:hypothetical protein
MAHTGDKFSHEELQRLKTEQDKKERDKIWTLHPAYIKAQYLSDEAKKHNAWIYHPEAKRWYTPEEFVAETSKMPDNAPIFNKIEIRRPVDGINAGHKQIAMMIEKLRVFTQRVMDYYARK